MSSASVRQKWNWQRTSIGAIAVAPSNPNIIYVGSGAGIIRPDLAIGNGVYKSTDAGKTWKKIGLDATRHISRIVVDPKNPDLVFVAAQGALYGTSKERGIYKSADGGKTWKNVLYVDEKKGAAHRGSRSKPLLEEERHPSARYRAASERIDTLRATVASLAYWVGVRSKHLTIGFDRHAPREHGGRRAGQTVEKSCLWP